MRSDAELVRAARSDPAAFRELYGRYAHQIYGFHVRRVRDVDAAHELTAETFAQAGRRKRVELAACAKLGMLERLDGPRSTVEPDESWLEGLDEAFAELPAGERRALELRVVDGLSYDHVAAELARTPGAARVRVARGLGRLRTRLTNDEQEAL